MLHLLHALLILFKMHFELKLSHIEVLYFIHACQIFPMSRHKRIHKQIFHKIVHLMEFFPSLCINNCQLSVIVDMKIFSFWYETTGKTGKKTVDLFLISFLVPEIPAFKEVKNGTKSASPKYGLLSKLWWKQWNLWRQQVCISIGTLWNGLYLINKLQWSNETLRINGS